MNRSALSRGEFVTLMALLMSLPAMSTDAMLPALADIGAALNVVDDNDRQWVISVLFLGMALPQLAYGPLSDRYGRRPLIFFSLAIFIIGTLLSTFAGSFTMMLCGRFLQGVGAAGPRIVTMALVRDQYSGDAMARIMSLIMAVFIIVPTIAPALGQAVLLFAHWRAIFLLLMLQALAALIWFALRQPETLAAEARRPLSFNAVGAAAAEVLGHRVALGYTLASGMVFGPFMGFLISVQQILQELYRLGDWFPLYFASLALVLGAASYLNSRLVTRFGMRAMCRWALRGLAALSLAFWLLAQLADGQPPLWSLMLYLMFTFGCTGILMGNLNSLAMEPLGHIAGTAAALIGTITSLLSLLFGALIGYAYNDSVLPLVIGFALLSLMAIAATRWAERDAPAGSSAPPRR